MNIRELDLYVEQGLAVSVAALIEEGKLSGVPEIEQRKLLSQALTHSAELHDRLRQSQMGLQHEAESDMFAIEMASFSLLRREASMDILLNPGGKPLHDQIQQHFHAF